MKDFNQIKGAIDQELEIYINNLFSDNGIERKYYYWSIDFFETVGELTFLHFDLNAEQKDRINKIGVTYFSSPEIEFSVNKNSHRNDILIRNITKLYTTAKIAKQSNTYEYLKEFVFWKLLVDTKAQLEKELKDANKISSNFSLNIIQDKKDELSYLSKIIEKQKSNFLFTYLTHLCKEHKKPIHKFFINKYLNFPLTNQAEELIKKLDEIDRNYVYDAKTGKEIRSTIQNLNQTLRTKIESLYVLKTEEQNLHFLFSKNSGGEKEELRELLEVMGDKDTGTLYRGQANSSWKLDASITRESKYQDNERDMYYDILSLKPDAFHNDKTVYERLITMQHFGMPTRLLDVTRNPLVAIFFACNNWERRDFDGVIFTFMPPSDKTKFLNFEDDRLECLPYLFNSVLPVGKTKIQVENFLSEIWFIKGVAKNQRINNQSGDFVFVGKGDDVKEKLSKLPQKTIIIDSGSKEILIQQLESLNIHGGAVYPDLTHMSNYISNKYKNGASSNVLSSVTKLTENETPKKKTRKKKVIKKEVIPTFDFETIKGKDRNIQLASFSKFYNLNKDGLNKIVTDFLFSERSPFRDEIKKISNDKLSVIKDKSKIDLLIDKITTLAKIVGEE
jgi:hypothetical protein